MSDRRRNSPAVRLSGHRPLRESALPLWEGRNRQRRFRGGVHSVLYRCREDRGAHTIEIRKHFIVLKSDDAHPVLRQPGIAPGISLKLGVATMLSPVDFHCQPPFSTEEVDNIRTDRSLPSEFQTFQLAPAENAPEPELCISQCAPHAFAKAPVPHRYLLVRHRPVRSQPLPEIGVADFGPPTRGGLGACCTDNSIKVVPRSLEATHA